MTTDFLLTSSLKAFLIYDAAATIELKEDKPFIEYVERKELNEQWLRIALMKWEIHHGFKLDIDLALEFSIEQLVLHAQSQSFRQKVDYMEHFIKRIEEINYIFEHRAFDDCLPELEAFDRETYLKNYN